MHAVETVGADCNTFPRVQMATIEGLLAGRKPQTPPSLLPYIAAFRRRGPVAEQLPLDSE